MKTIQLLMVLLLAGSQQLYAFCGFYVAKADATLFNTQSQIILVRDGQRSVITMANDFQGPTKDFAMVVPVPVVLQEKDIRVVDKSLFDKLDAYSAPRMVEYHDHNPCEPVYLYSRAMSATKMRNVQVDAAEMVEEEYQVTIEAEYTIGEYDILILSAKESDGLKNWLTDNGYQIPSTANEVLDPYIKDQMKFFVVKVNLEKFQRSSAKYLRPIQIEFESDRFMLPIRLGMANAKGDQDMMVYAFTRSGRVETTNYRTVKVPSNRNIPEFVQRDEKFSDFYVDLFDKSYQQEGKKAVFLEYAWNVGPNSGIKCDPCVSPPPIFADFKEAGVDWATSMDRSSSVFFTRLHIRYSRNKFPQDLVFQVTPNRENFQGRYIITHPAKGNFSCEEGQEYLQSLTDRRQRELDELAVLTGWDVSKYSSYLNEGPVPNYRDHQRENEVLPIMPKGNGPHVGMMLLFISTILLLLFYFTGHFLAPHLRLKRALDVAGHP